MPRLSVRERYHHDLLFRTAVDTLVAFAEQAHAQGNTLTPTEFREAAMLAATIFEERHVRPIFHVEPR